MLKRYRSAAVGVAALFLTSALAVAAGSWSNLPSVGQSSFCNSTVTGAGGLGGVTGQGQASTGSICASTTPAGPPAITGNETIPADTNLPAGNPQTVTISTGMLGGAGQGGFRNLLVGGDFFTNPWQRGTTPISATTAATATMSADRFFAYSSGNTLTIAKKTTGADISAANSILASMQVNRPSGTDVTPICVGQVLPATETQNLLGKNAVFSFFGLNGAAMSGANGAVQVSIAYATASDSATPGTNTDAFAKSTIAGYTAVTALSPNTTGTVAAAVATIPLSTTWTRYAVYGAIPTTATQVGVKICYTPVGTGVATDFFDIARVQLEATNQTSAGSFAHRPAVTEAELAYTYSYGLVEKTTVVYPGGVLCSSTANAHIAINLPVAMKTTPVVTVTAGGWSIKTAAATTAIGTTTLLAASPQAATLTSGAACTSTLPYQLVGTNTTGLFMFSAEP